MTSKKTGTIDQPLSAEKKKAVIDKFEESGKADDIGLVLEGDTITFVRFLPCRDIYKYFP